MNFAFHLGDLFSVANLLALLAIWRKLSIRDYQHNLMWTDFARRKGLNGHAPASLYAHGSQRGEDALNGIAEKAKGASAS